MPTVTKNKRAVQIALTIITCLLLMLVVSLIVKIYIESNRIFVSPPSTDYKHSGRLYTNTTESPHFISFYNMDIEINDTIPVNEFTIKDFISYDTGFITYNGDNAVYGIDVSSFQKDIDWPAVKNSGIDFAIIRLGFRGMSKGTLYVDDYFNKNLVGALSAGVDVGIYFFSQATTIEEAEEEAQYVLSVLDGQYLEYPIFFDWEPGTDAVDRTNPIYSSPVINDFAVKFCDVISEAGYKTGIYFNNYQGYLQYDLSLFTEETLWLAEYGTHYPSYYYKIDMWQYSCTGNIDGISVPVDINIYFKNN